MEIKKSDIKLIVAALLFFAALGSFYFCKFSLSGKTEQLEAENATLQTEVDYLQELMNNKEQYIAETEAMQAEITNIKGQFPADVKPEDQIIYANKLELKNAILVEAVAMPGKEIVTVADPVATAAPVVTDDGAVDDGTDVPVDDAVEAPVTSSLASSVVLYRSPTTVTFKSTYKSVKDVIAQINEDTKDKKSIDSLSLAFDEETGNLTGTLMVQFYSLSGTENEYQVPSVTGVSKGTNNIFGTSENVNALRTSTTGSGTDDENVEDNADTSKDDKTEE